MDTREKPLPRLRVLLLLACVRGAVSAATRVVLDWLLKYFTNV